MTASNLCSMADQDKTRDQWRRAFSPISSRETETWLQEWKDELSKIPYLRLIKASAGGMLNLIEMRGMLNLPGLNFSMVKADLERVWAVELSSGMRSSHTFRESESGLTFYFSALTKNNNYVTGALSIARKE